jgi:dTDP-4-dehydrorhamnose 3,5-epimerase
MQIRRLEIPEVFLVKPVRRGDDRGWFAETFKAGWLADQGVTHPFVQDNMSLSRIEGTLRGLHFQSPPHAQAKLVSVLSGRILDVAVDARRGSPTYGRHVSAELDAEEGWQIYVPVGFLHGFVTRAPDTRVAYKVSDVYAPDCDGGVLWNDPDLAIDWGLNGATPELSAKDAVAQRFADFNSPF